MEVALEEGVIIFDNYFAVSATDLSCLVSLPTEDGRLYHIVADVSFTLEDGTKIVYFYGDQSIVSTESSVVSANDNQSFSDVITSASGWHIPTTQDWKILERYLGMNSKELNLNMAWSGTDQGTQLKEEVPVGLMQS